MVWDHRRARHRSIELDKVATLRQVVPRRHTLRTILDCEDTRVTSRSRQRNRFADVTVAHGPIP